MRIGKFKIIVSNASNSEINNLENVHISIGIQYIITALINTKIGINQIIWTQSIISVFGVGFYPQGFWIYNVEIEFWNLEMERESSSQQKVWVHPYNLR